MQESSRTPSAVQLLGCLAGLLCGAILLCNCSALKCRCVRSSVPGVKVLPRTERQPQLSDILGFNAK